MHAEDDGVIHVSHAAKLRAAVRRPPVPPLVVARGGHDGLVAENADAYYETLAAFLRALDDEPLTAGAATGRS